MKDTDKIISEDWYWFNDYLVVMSKIERYRLSKKDMRGRKFAYIVSCIDTTAKDWEIEAFCARIRTKKDAFKYFTLLFSYLGNYGKDGFMKVWDEVDKCFDYKITLNENYTIHPWAIVRHAKSVYKNEQV
ncbi:MAG: hypothetical protein J6R59_01765 [Paludibacteraceae bacterium]|nr:hypothetical protein [Paludibacteraceae bacterium]